MGLPITAFMDRNKIIIAREQMNFIERLCLPLYTIMAQSESVVDRHIRMKPSRVAVKHILSLENLNCTLFVLCFVV